MPAGTLYRRNFNAGCAIILYTVHHYIILPGHTDTISWTVLPVPSFKFFDTPLSYSVSFEQHLQYLLEAKTLSISIIFSGSFQIIVPLSNSNKIHLGCSWDIIPCKTRTYYHYVCKTPCSSFFSLFLSLPHVSGLAGTDGAAKRADSMPSLQSENVFDHQQKQCQTHDLQGFI